jgi:hypothetical protein
VDDIGITYCEVVVKDLHVVAAGLRQCDEDDDDLNSEIEQVRTSGMICSLRHFATEMEPRHISTRDEQKGIRGNVVVP